VEYRKTFLNKHVRCVPASPRLRRAARSCFAKATQGSPTLLRQGYAGQPEDKSDDCPPSPGLFGLRRSASADDRFCGRGGSGSSPGGGAAQAVLLRRPYAGSFELEGDRPAGLAVGILTAGLVPAVNGWRGIARAGGRPQGAARTHCRLSDRQAGGLFGLAVALRALADRP